MPLAVATALALANCAAPNSQSNKETTAMNSKQSEPKQQVRDLLKSIETGDSAPVGAINADKYIQHNASAKDGLAGSTPYSSRVARLSLRKFISSGADVSKRSAIS